MKSSLLFRIFSSLLLSSAAPLETSSTTTLKSRADTSLVGYLGAFFLGDEPYVYFDLSNGNNAISFTPLNSGNPIIIPTTGTGGVRDPSIIVGSGPNDCGSKWYIIGTDLDISKTTWDASQRTGSKGIYVWESTDLISWTDERLVVVEEDTAGMVWAPDAIWDVDAGQYLVHWASRFYDASDKKHTGTASKSIIRFAHTSDFKTFTEPQTYIQSGDSSDIIDLSILPLEGEGHFARFLKNETAKYTFSEMSTDGLFGAWTRIGGPNSQIRSSTEGPASYADNLVTGKYHLLLDYYGSDGYRPFYATERDLQVGNWTDDDRTNFQPLRRHGSVVGIKQEQYDALSIHWS